MITRRQFLRHTIALGAGLFITSRIAPERAFANVALGPAEKRAGGIFRRTLAQIPGGTLDPNAIAKYQTPLLIPPAMPRASRITVNGQAIDYYEIAVRQFQEQILPAGLPATTVWGYGPKVGQPAIFNAPSLTIEATAGIPTRIKWINELVAADGTYLPHLLAVDPTLHWANPAGGTAERDRRPTFTTTPGPYTGPVPMVTHVHGAVGVGDESDGYAEAWYLPAANNIPGDYARVGTWYDRFATQANQKFGLAWGSGYATFQYPNQNRASTIWYHDHVLGMTRLNVYAGPAGFYIVRGGPAGDSSVLDSRTGTAAKLPGPAPARDDKAGKKYYEIPIAVQDRAFNTDGSLFYPDTRAFFDGITGPYLPDTDISPIWNPEFFGNCIMVNGNTWPFQTVEKRRYRLRFLNGCQARFLILDFNNIPGVEVWQIGNEGGFLAAPVNITANHGNQLLMGNAERADMIVDFTNVPVGNYVLGNVGPDAPFAGLPVDPAEVADPATTGQIMQFQVVPAVAPDPTTPPQFLQLPAIAPLPTETVTRRLALLEEMSMFFADAPAAAMLGTVDGDPNTGEAPWMMQMWSDPITENPAIGATEVWELYNGTVDAHPMHIHEVVFQLVDRQAIFVNEGNRTFQIVPGSTPLPPEPWETGYKDTVIALPGQVTRVRAKFSTPGQFVWHCHIVEHEDNEMMRPYFIDASASFPRTPVIDNFDRPNGKINSGWKGEVGAYLIVNQAARVRWASTIYWNPQTFGPNQEAYFTFTNVSSVAQGQALILKNTGGSPTGYGAKWIEVLYAAPTSSVQIRTDDNPNGFQIRATINNVTFGPGDQFGARALADGQVIVFKNGIAIGSHYLTSGTKPWPASRATGGGKIGVWFRGAGNYDGASKEIGFDNFGGGDL
jgi:spore coat protein A, manganese oxidase